MESVLQAVGAVQGLGSSAHLDVCTAGCGCCAGSGELCSSGCLCCRAGGVIRYESVR